MKGQKNRIPSGILSLQLEAEEHHTQKNSHGSKTAMSKFDPKNRQAVQDYLAGLAQFISRLKSRAFLRRFVNRCFGSGYPSYACILLRITDSLTKSLMREKEEKYGNKYVTLSLLA